MILIGQILLFALQAYSWVIIASVIASWLIVFDVINAKNPQARNLLGLLERMTEPVYKPIRKYVPPISGIDLTPLIVLLGIWILQNLVVNVFMT